MAATHELKFESPSFYKRIKGMLGVDFYRLFRGKLEQGVIDQIVIQYEIVNRC